MKPGCLVQEFGYRYSKCCRQPRQVVESKVALAAFNGADVSAMQAALVSQFLLAPAAQSAQTTQVMR